MYKKLIYIFLALSFFLLNSTSFSCTRVLHIDKKQGVIVGRNMDWFERMNTKLAVLPRGILKEGHADKNSLKWVSKFGSIVAASYDTAVTDGMNEKGLAVHGLWLEPTDYGQRNENIPGISLMMLMQYYLDNFQTVSEVIQKTQSGEFQVLPYFHPNTNRWVRVHFAIEDANGDSAIIEYINGEPKIYHDKQYKVLTNEPIYSSQLKNLQQYIGFGGKKELPGSTSASDRFVRTSYFEARLPAMNSNQETVEGVLSVLQNASPPFTKEGDSQYARTIWRTVADLTHRVYYFISTANMTTVYASLDDFDLRPGAPIMMLDLVKYPTLSGNVTHEFKSIH